MILVRKPVHSIELDALESSKFIGEQSQNQLQNCKIVVRTEKRKR